MSTLNITLKKNKDKILKLKFSAKMCALIYLKGPAN